MNIFIGGAWPYANGSLHIGHIASLLPGDILARYFRIKGENVLYVSGSDCHGTPIMIRAAEEGTSPRQAAEKFHLEFKKTFDELGFTYDLYTRTDDPFHHQEVQKIFMELLEKNLLYRRNDEQVFCEICRRFLPDRYVEGHCPQCGHAARGDQCDNCSALLHAEELENLRCKLCGNSPVLKETEHFYLALSRYQEIISSYVHFSRNNSLWRDNAIGLTSRYLSEGLSDRAATRDLELGVEVPVDGFQGKKIYVWIEAVAGYLTASKKWAALTGGKWEAFWKDSVEAYYVHGKDNIPFHTIIWPAILEGLGFHLPDRIISSEYLTLEKKKISTSRNYAIWAADLLSRYDPDSIRYFLTINGPEKRDADFSWREFIHSHNSELLGAYGNLVNRTFKFIEKSFGGEIEGRFTDTRLKSKISLLYQETGEKIKNGEFKSALESIFALVREANKRFDEQKPWLTVRNEQKKSKETLYESAVIIANLANLLEPFLPFSSKKVRESLSIAEPCWHWIEPHEFRLSETNPLFERIDLDKIDEEIKRLENLK
ncbi:methionine--tRNA ligase [Peribacillus deserti]|uniref:Methionine--tRNA ligase n=1 Tax=Peribacillus deserti TaxID=673318 RepID=A0A2N5LZX8_9BACI|nr:methionine--tRNA ligase [Peribacillus deserti]PLT27660.1 methionine--tRNA ligase [Peribacillus deserti]